MSDAKSLSTFTPVENLISIEASTLTRLNYALLTMCVLFRVMMEHEPFPWWSSDPYSFAPPLTGLTPSATLLLNGIISIISIVCIASNANLNTRRGLALPTLLLLGCSGLTYHMFQSTEHAAAGSNYLAILSTFAAASRACLHRELKDLLSAIVIPIGILFISIGFYEVFVIHPITVENYQLNRLEFLHARGWQSDSVEALAYERRLNQPEPVAWFSLSNVFASFVGASTASFLILLVAARKSKLTTLILSVASIALFSGLLLTQSKGGIAAFALGLAVFFLGKRVLLRTIRIGNLLVVSCLFLIAGIFLRGIIGESLSELSLYFRYQYFIGSLKIFAQYPFVGVGPSSFQEFYTIYKPALSPEDVASAHNPVFDLIATLGISGLAIIAYFALLLRNTVFHNSNHPYQNENTTNQFLLPNRQTVHLLSGIVLIPTVLSIRFSTSSLDISLLTIHLMAAVIWVSCSLFIVSVDRLRNASQFALIASASVLLIHSMIEVSATWFVSGTLFALIVGLSCNLSNTIKNPAPTKVHSNISTCVTIGAIALPAFGVFYQLSRVYPWESQLRLASIPARDQSQLENLPPDQIVTARKVSIKHLQRATELRPTHIQTHISLSQQYLWLASFYQHHNEIQQVKKFWNEAIQIMEMGNQHSTLATGLSWLATIYKGRENAFPEDERVSEWRLAQYELLQQAHARSPNSPQIVFKLMNLADQLNSKESAQSWAQQVLILHDNTRLDPLKGLTESELKVVHMVLAPK